MALTRYTPTSNIGVGASYLAPQWYFKLTHTQATGSDGMLVVVLATTSSLALTNVKYGGTTMTQSSTWFTAPGSTKYSVWYLYNPPTGSNDVTADSTNNGTCAMLAQSFTGADTTIQTLHNGLTNTPHGQSITVLNNSKLMAISSSLYSFDTNAAITIDGTAKAFASTDMYGSVSTAQFCVWTKWAAQSAGPKIVITDTIADSFQATNTRIEIREAAATIVIPTVTTDDPATDIKTCSMTRGGNVTADGGATVTERGMVYHPFNSTPTTDDFKVVVGSGTGTFDAVLPNLASATKYYARAYAINSAGTAYGEFEQDFTATFDTEHLMSYSQDYVDSLVFAGETTHVLTNYSITEDTIGIHFISVMYNPTRAISDIEFNDGVTTTGYVRTISHTDTVSGKKWEVWQVSGVSGTGTLTLTMSGVYTDNIGFFSTSVKNCVGILPAGYTDEGVSPATASVTMPSARNGLIYQGAIIRTGDRVAQLKTAEIIEPFEHAIDIYSDGTVYFAGTINHQFCAGTYDATATPLSSAPADISSFAFPLRGIDVGGRRRIMIID
jgi:hypothetical protein